ncbi:MAG: hypothetical protein WBF17_24445 [Phycisphaerae bacterium]
MRLNLTYHRDEWRSVSGCGTPTAGTYKGFDRFGRIATQAWRAYTAGAIREQLDYGYDPPSRPCRYGGASRNSGSGDIILHS